ncbi:MAG: hypothetical protein FWD65_04385 [Coriobacteriia bacterium]|nr:hypothetical protein [Coriobacteriia bacterium]
MTARKKKTQLTKAEGGNLTPFDNTPEGRQRAREAASKGTVKGVTERTRRRTMREGLLQLLACPLPDDWSDQREFIAIARGIPEEEVTVQDALEWQAVIRGLSGDNSSFLTIRDTVGDAPTCNVNMNATIPVPLAPIKDSDD